MAPQFGKQSRMNSHGSLSLSIARQQWLKNYINSSTVGVHSMKREKAPGFPKHHFKAEVDKSAYQFYAGQFRKSAGKTKSRNVHSNSDLKGRDSGIKPFHNKFNIYEHGCEMGKKHFGDEIEEHKKPSLVHDQYKTKFVPNKILLLEEFRRVYRRFKTHKIPKQSVRTDHLAWEEMKKRHGGVLQPEKTFGHVRGVEIGDTFNLRLELKIMGIHSQSVSGIDSKAWGPCNTLLVTSVVATEGYEDNMTDPDVLMYTGEGGGNFERRNSNQCKMIKDQVLKRGNLALKNSMRVRTVVRVVRGMKRGGRYTRSNFVYDGLYKVNGCREIKGPSGNKQFVFKLERCANQKQIIWANYK